MFKHNIVSFDTYLNDFLSFRFRHGRKARAHFLQGNSEYPSENLFPVLKRVGSVVLNPKRGGICN